MRRTYYNNFSFLDLLFNFLLATVTLLIIAVLFIITEKNKADIETKAEFVITMEWNGNQDKDFDIWIQDPENNLLWYNNREVGVMHNDIDDRGHLTDHQEGKAPIFINQEIVTIRGTMEGEWIVNVHLFRIGGAEIDKQPAKVKITMLKLNPKSSIVFNREYTMNTYWEQKCVARFHMTANGEIMNVSEGPFKNLIQSRVFPHPGRAAEANMPLGGVP